jgi:hypothetical protein
VVEVKGCLHIRQLADLVHDGLPSAAKTALSCLYYSTIFPRLQPTDTRFFPFSVNPATRYPIFSP